MGSLELLVLILKAIFCKRSRKAKILLLKFPCSLQNKDTKADLLLAELTRRCKKIQGCQLRWFSQV